MANVPAFVARVDWRLGRSAEAFGQAVRGIMNLLAAKGMLGSGARIKKILEALRQQFEIDVIEVIGLTKTAAGQEVGGWEEIKEHAVSKLRAHYEALVALSKLPGRDDHVQVVESTIRPEFDRLRSFIDFAFSQVEEGYPPPTLSEARPISTNIQSNTVHVGSHAVVGALQQASDGSTQIVHLEISVTSVREALQGFEHALTETAAVPPDQRAEMQADIDTIKAQLAKPTPNSTILSEAGKALKWAVEKLTTPGLTSAGTALWLSLGLV